MKERPKLRRFCKWVGFGTLLGAVAIAVASLFFMTSIRGHGRSFVIFSGCLIIDTPGSTAGTTQKGWKWGGIRKSKIAGPSPMFRYWWVRIHRRAKPGVRGTLVSVPLWIPTVFLAIPTYILWRRDRRYPPGHCQRCDYNLTGNVSGVCPECETKIEAA